ncbi:MAG: hypothetical protein AAGH41_02705 [Pseudomonadota bacterium]
MKLHRKEKQQGNSYIKRFDSQIHNFVNGRVKSKKEDYDPNIKETQIRAPVALIPTFHKTVQAKAKALGMNYVDFVRKSLMAALANPDSLRSPEVERQEVDYARRSKKPGRQPKHLAR